MDREGCECSEKTAGILGAFIVGPADRRSAPYRAMTESSGVVAAKSNGPWHLVVMIKKCDVAEATWRLQCLR